MVNRKMVKELKIAFFLLFFLFLLPLQTAAQNPEEKLETILQELLEIRTKITLLQEESLKLNPLKYEEALAIILKSAGFEFEDSLKMAYQLGLIGENFKNTFEPIVLNDFLEILFKTHKITPKENNFLSKSSENLAILFAKILNLIPDSKNGSEKLSRDTAVDILNRFLLIKDRVYPDNLYGKIDMHEHYRTGGNLEEFFGAAGSLGVSKTIFVPTGFGPDNQGYKNYQTFLVKYYKKLYPDKIIAFCTIDEADPEAAEVLEECLKAGGEGLKLLGGHPNFYDEPLNSANMYRVYKTAAKYNVPILIHASIINIPGLEEQLEQIFSDFPEVTFIHAHYCSSIFSGINLEKCQALLDKHPSVYIDLSMGGGIKRYHKYLREDLKKIRDFVIKNQDRILFGSDIILDKTAWKNFDFVYERMKCDLDLHQKENYTCSYGEKDIGHQGFNLSKEILRKLYYENPLKVLNPANKAG